MSSRKPFIVLPLPKLGESYFEYPLPDLMESFRGASRLATEKLSEYPRQGRGMTRSQICAAFEAIVIKSDNVMKILSGEQEKGCQVVVARSKIADGVRPEEGQPNNTFLAQYERGDISFER